MDRPGLRFTIREGRNENFFLQDRRVNVHVVWRTSPPHRLQFCFPEGNSGVSADLSGQLEARDEIGSWGPVNGLHGAEATLVAQGPVSLSGLCLDSLRTLRDGQNSESGDRRRELRDAGALPAPCLTVESNGAHSLYRWTTLGLSRRWNYALELEVSSDIPWNPQGSGGTWNGPQKPWTLKVRAGHSHPLLVPLGEDRVLSASATTFLQSMELGPSREAFLAARRNLAFLSFEEKLLAGSWRFLTYFGRDSLLTSLLLGSTASLALHEAVLKSVLARLSPVGQVAHEEDIGEQAAYRRWEAPEEGPDPKTVGDPVYDYKMVDDDFLLLPALAAVVRHPEAGPEWWPRFRDKHHEALDSNIRWCLSRLNQLIGIEHEFVGDWRDSYAGLGGGFYPNSVNVGIVPVFLDALTWYYGDPLAAQSRPEFWPQVPGLYRVRLTSEQVRDRLGAFLATKPVGSQEGDWLRSRVLAPGVQVSDWLAGRGNVPALDKGLTFSALSRDRYERPIEVIHSDLSFRLFLADPKASELDEILTLLELPYPLGLAHPVGFLVANPVMSGNPELWDKLDRHGYHGAVVWSWQDAMIALGLARQARREDLAPDLLHRIEALRTVARKQRARAGALVSSELWTWTIEAGEAVPTAFGAGALDETESNAVQLWSSAGLALTTLG